MTKRILSIFLILALLLACAPISIPEAQAVETVQSKAGYMTLEEAAAVLREKMEQRSTESFTLKFILEDERLYWDGQIFDMLIDLATKHTGVPTQGDYLSWHYNSFGYTMEEDDFDGKTHRITFTFYMSQYLTTFEEEQILANRINEVLASLNLSGKSDYEKVKAIYDYICANVTYDDETYERYGQFPDISIPSVRHAFTAYGALINGTSVCQGYSTLLYRMLLEAGIDNRIITSADHGWNLIQLGDLYYLADSTWDAGFEEKYCFLQGYSRFWEGDHHDPAALLFGTEEFLAEYPIAVLDYGVAQPDPNAVLGSGTCGSNATWDLTGDGTLTIRGSGSIECEQDASGNWYSPWVELGCYVKKVVIEDGITEIGNCLFRNLHQLTSVTIPNTVTSMGDQVFRFCTALEQITLPNSLTTVGKSIFEKCFRLKDVTLSSSLTEIPYGMFLCCTAIKRIDLPGSIQSIGDAAFAHCYNLTGITIPSSVKTIGNSAFSFSFDPDAKASVTVPASVTFVDFGAFDSSNIYEMDWKANTTAIAYGTFNLCYYLEKVTMSNAVQELGYQAFCECTSLKEVTLSNNLKKAESATFMHCVALERITLPDSLHEIPSIMFESCISLKDVKMSDKVTRIDHHAFSRCYALEEINLPKSLTTLGTFAFAESTALREITIPAGVTELPGGLFFCCSGLQNVYFEGDAPAFLEDLGIHPFGGVSCTAYYPSGNATWTPDKLQSFDGSVTWVSKHGADAPHTPASEWLTDNSSHWHGCTGCDAILDKAPHAYDHGCDTDCNICGATRTTSHRWDNDCDTSCNTCGATRVTTHTYDHGCDTSCNICGATRTTSHRWDNDCDTDCNICGATRTTSHRWDSGVVSGQHTIYTCTVCGNQRQESTGTTDPSDPVDPDPSEGTQPTDPVDPDPSEGTEPTDPSTPTNPAQSGTSAQPGASPQPDPDDNSLWIIIAAVGGAVLLVGGTVAVIFIKKKKAA